MLETRLIFLRHGKLDLPYPSHDQMPYRLIVDIANRTMDPPLDKTDARERVEGLVSQIPFAEVDHVYVSTFTRNQQTGQILNEQIEKFKGAPAPIETLPELNEMRMDLYPMYPHDLTTPVDLPYLMNLIFEETVHGTHVESVAEMLARIEKLFDILTKEVGTILCVSHDNFLRVVELYVKAKGKIEAESVTAEQLKATKKKEYLRGFMTDGELQTFTEIE